uniref:Uncharacterized protein n=1 Tax=Anguilla anguilla TaxID=7936 RepID=A0A0E9XB97_ANGAN
MYKRKHIESIMLQKSHRETVSNVTFNIKKSQINALLWGLSTVTCKLYRAADRGHLYH